MFRTQLWNRLARVPRQCLAAWLLGSLILSPIVPWAWPAAAAAQPYTSPQPTQTVDPGQATPGAITPAPDPQPAPDALEEPISPGLTADPRWVVADGSAPDLSALPEAVERRTAQSAVYRTGKDRYVAILSSQPLHHQDQDGNWLPIDPAFRALDDSYLVEHNLVRGRVGAQRAWMSVAVDGIAFVWQAEGLGAAGEPGAFVELATALKQPPAFARQDTEGNRLHYADGWSNPAVSEEIVSFPGSVEHATILSQPLVYEGAAEFLELRATLRLVPGTALWADGVPVKDRVLAAETLAVRDAEGGPGLILAPVLAFERARPSVAVAGTYAVYPTAQADTWLIGVRTPWAWWTDPGRIYPAVLDPVITVQRSTGWGEGLAWVRNTGDKAYTLGEMRLGAYLPDYNTQSRGYVQFNSLPALLSNAPLQVTAAYLDVEPADLFLPQYSYKGKGFTDWDSVPLKRKATLAYAGACPSDPGCNGFSLQDNRLTDPMVYNWDNQPGAVDIGTETLTVGPMKSSGNANPTVTTWDVTAQIQSWYTAWYDQSNPRPGPTFQMRFVDNSGSDAVCPKPMPYVSGFVNGIPQFDSNLVPQCTHFSIPPGNVKLRIEYTELPLAIGDNLLNASGVPSYSPLSGSTENLFVKPNHQYSLAQPGAGTVRWRAVALRGNHDYTQVLPAWATLKLLDYTAVTASTDEPEQLLNPKAPGPDQTTFFFIDDHLTGSSLDSADLRVEVVASSENDYTGDQQRNYRLEYIQSTLMSTLTYGAPNVELFTMFSDELIQITEFHLNKGDTVGITATVPISLEMMLILPATQGGNAGALLSANHSNINRFSKAQPGGTLQTFSFTAPATGQYALVLVNHERPSLDPDRNLPVAWTAQATILPCPAGSYPTAKHGCQPLILPDALTPDPPKSVPIPGGGSLNVYSEGGFTPGADWCTQNEAIGAPIIGPDVDGRWGVVVQGSVCYQGGTLTTSADSAVGILVYTGAPNPISGRMHGQILPIATFGNEMLLPGPGQPDGQVTLVSGGRLQPDGDTIRRITPFAEHWEGTYVHDDDHISLVDMQSHGAETVQAEVTVDAAGNTFAVDWAVSWSLYPFTCPTCPVQWAFVDDPALPSTTFPLELDLASTKVRMLNAGLLDGEVRELDAYLKAGGPVAFQFRNATSRLTVGPLLGGTTKPVHVVIQPPLWPRAAEGEGSCEAAPGSPSSCLDLRRGEYAWDALGDSEQNVNPWSLPDLHIETLPATAIFSSEGQLNIFSTDHPAATSDIGQTFSFDTWEAGVHVVQEKCVATDPAESTVIRGDSYIALPTLGDDGSGSTGSWVKAAFKLCETSLQQAHIEFGIPKPGIPVGSTGVGVHILDGTVTIDPNSGDTRITLGVDFQTLDGYTLTDGRGTVTLDTAGMLSLQATGQLVGVVSADELRLDVAWNPLDLLFKGEVSYGGGLLSGSIKMHGWIGQGWQGKYPWLLDTDDFHFTGAIAATVTLKSGAVVDEWPFVLPPFTLKLTAEVAFGEFCTSSSCTSYDWGMSATVKVLGYKVGVYVDNGGPDLILGSSSHKLIDEFVSSAQALGVPAVPPPSPVYYPGIYQASLTPAFSSPFDGLSPSSASSACSGVGTPVVICPFAVNPGTGRALFTASWQNGNLGVSLIKPNNTVVTAANASANGVVYSTTVSNLQHVVAFGVITPTIGSAIDSGEWKVRLENVGQGLAAGLKNNYNLLFAADPPAATLAWASPVSLSPSQVRLPWTASRGGQALNPDLEVELFAIAADQQPITPTAMAGSAIVQKISANGGQYDWDLSGLPAGTYAYGARLDDHATGNGHPVVWSPYTVTLVDATPPPMPTIAGSFAYTDTVLVFWYRDDTTRDLAGYLVEYTVPEWDLASALPQIRRVLPSKKSESPIVERVLLGGLFLSTAQPISTDVCVRAYDASGNVSDCTPTLIEMPEMPQTRLGAPEDLALNSDGLRITVDWVPSASRVPPGSLLDYGPVGCLLERPSRTADEGPSPLVYGPAVTSGELTGLTPGQVYEVGVRGYRDNGEIGPRIAGRTMHIDPADADADGIPDEWAEIFGLERGTNDLDGDGLSDAAEYRAASNPRRADSDGDGAYDSQEVEAGSDPCDPGDRPQREAPRLALVGDAALHFATATNLGAPGPQFISIWNAGGGTLAWAGRASAPWIAVSPAAGSGIGTLGIAVNPEGLAPGLYSGLVTIANTGEAIRLSSGMAALAESVDIPVTMLVLPPKESGEHKVYLPVVGKSW